MILANYILVLAIPLVFSYIPKLVMKDKTNKERKIETCSRCSYFWIPKVKHPVMCPNCKTPYFNRKRVRNVSEDRKAKAYYQGRTQDIPKT